MWNKLLTDILNWLKKRSNLDKKISLHIQSSKDFKDNMDKRLKTLEKHIDQRLDGMDDDLKMIKDHLINKGGK